MASPRRARVGGSGYTTFVWQREPIAFARQVAHVSPAPVGPGATPIQALGEPHPTEIITPAAVGMGQLTLELYELYNGKVWDQLQTITGANDLVNIFRKVADLNIDEINLVKLIRPPRGARGNPSREVYHGVVVTNVADGETIEVGTMEVLKQITVAYTRYSRDGGGGGNQGGKTS